MSGCKKIFLRSSASIFFALVYQCFYRDFIDFADIAEVNSLEGLGLHRERVEENAKGFELWQGQNLGFLGFDDGGWRRGGSWR